jgi:hypothetical protein
MNEQIVEKYLRNFEMWCWRRIDKIRKADRVINEEALHRGKEYPNILLAVKRGKLTGVVTSCLGTAF